MLNSLRIGVVKNQDCCTLSNRLLILTAKNQNNWLKEIISYFRMLSDDTVCLFLTKNMCNQFNAAMLESMEQPEIKLNSIDEIDCLRYFKKRANEVFKKNEDDSSLTAVLENVITIKIGARVIL